MTIEESVDIVDEQNQVLYQANKSAAHQKGLLHRIILAEIRDSHGNFIFVKQAADRQDPGRFVSPVGGHIQAGESELDALKREAAEEVGFTNFTHKRTGQITYHRQVIGRDENHLFILYEIYSDSEPVLNHESVDYVRLSPDEVVRVLQTNPDMFGPPLHFVLKNFYPDIYLKSRK